MVDTYSECQLGEKLRELVSDFGASGAEVSTKRKIMLTDKDLASSKSQTYPLWMLTLCAYGGHIR